VPLSTIKDPKVKERAQAAMDRAWTLLQERGIVQPDRIDAQRQRLAAYIEGYAIIGAGEDDLVRRAIERFERTL
jgi:hypothetical protein